MAKDDIYALYGAVVVMAGGSTLHWTTRDVSTAVALCASLGVDTLSIKVADGAQVWHTPAEYASYRAVAKAKGVGLVPFLYVYTRNQFGRLQLEAQASLIRQYMEVNEDAGCVIDMEVEYDNQSAEAEAFAALLQNLPGPLVVSTWANPGQHGYAGVIKAMKPVTSLWGPQEYNDSLATKEGQFPADVVLAVEVDLTQEFGTNHQQTIARQAKARGHNSLWLWSYEATPKHQGLVAELVSIMHDESVPAPLPVPAGDEYTVVHGDTLSEIAANHKGTGNYLTWYQANKAGIDERAREAGMPTPYYNWIFPGQVLQVPKE